MDNVKRGCHDKTIKTPSALVSSSEMSHTQPRGSQEPKGFLLSGAQSQSGPTGSPNTCHHLTSMQPGGLNSINSGHVNSGTGGKEVVTPHKQTAKLASVPRKAGEC